MNRLYLYNTEKSMQPLIQQAITCQNSGSRDKTTSSVQTQTAQVKGVNSGGPDEMAETANEALLLAAENGCLAGIEAALKAGADIDYAQPESELESKGPAMFIASVKGDADMVRLLLRKGASVAKRCGSFAPLHGAASKGKTEVVELLVNHGATLDVRDVFQNTPLMYACGFEHVDTVRRLLELGARPDLTDGFIGKRLGIASGNFDSSDEGIKLILAAMKTKLLRCCNPKCGKPGYKSTGALKLCARCKMTRYCSRDCQKQHWSVGHKKCCGHDAFTVEQTDPLQKIMLLMSDHILEHGYDDFVSVSQSLVAHVKRGASANGSVPGCTCLSGRGEEKDTLGVQAP
ncbi:uncharacterized protein [Branchiostoma lanceolatum]|uniref:uncharacterized protein n=1 Tax=Branchiostoma lanceolatum TaxID=7740 RepID=UPI00345639AE